MTTTRISLFALLFVHAAGCATADDNGTTPVYEPVADASSDGSANRPDVSIVETAPVDAAPQPVDADPSADALADAAPCVYPATETKACGACGFQTRFCLPQGVWTGFSDCQNQRADVACKIGERRTSDCDRCGKATDFCDPKTCEWVTGLCVNQGACDPGAVEQTAASCAVSGEVRSRVCSDKCGWSPFSTCGEPRGWLPMAEAPISGRFFHSAVWTGSKMVIYGGHGTWVSPTYYKADGAAYDLVSNRWTPIASAPFALGRARHATVWTGSKMIVWGGRESSVAFNDGAAYDPATDSWAPIANAPLSVRHGMGAAWSTTTNEMLVWGGCGNTGSGIGLYTCTSLLGDGAAYDPEKNTWTMLPAAPLEPRFAPTVVWTGTEMIVFGGTDSQGNPWPNGARFDPATRIWTRFTDPPANVMDPRAEAAAVWNGKGLVVWGGRRTTAATGFRSNGAIYQPGVGWSPIAPAADTLLTPSARRIGAAAWWGNEKFYVFSGIGATSSSSTTAVSGFASYDPDTDGWTALDTTNAPSQRYQASVIWTGKEALIWGGGPSTSVFSPSAPIGAIYRP